MPRVRSIPQIGPTVPPHFFYHKFNVRPSQTPARKPAMILREWAIQNSARLQRRFRNCRKTSFGNLSQIDVLAEPVPNHGPAQLVYKNDITTVYNNDTRGVGGRGVGVYKPTTRAVPAEVRY
jgi:hypothetical protein